MSTRRSETRIIGNLPLEAGVEVNPNDFLMRHNKTKLVRPAADLPDYTGIGQCQQYASSIGKKNGEAFTSVIQGELLGDNDTGAPVRPEDLTETVYFTGPRSVGITSRNKVFAGRVVDFDGDQVLFVLATTGQP
jgi:hypothetical protein